MILRAVHGAQRAHRLIHEIDEVWIEVAHGIRAHRREHARIGVARARTHEEALGWIHRRWYERASRCRFDDRRHASPSFCASPMRCSFPVAPTGMASRIRIFRGTLYGASRDEANSRSSLSVAAFP